LVSTVSRSLLGPPLHPQRLGGIERFLEAVYPQHACASKSRVKDVIVTGKCADVGGRCLGALVVTSLDCEHWLHASGRK